MFVKKSTTTRSARFSPLNYTAHERARTQTHVVSKLTHTQIAILDNIYSDDVIVMGAKIENFAWDLLEFPSVKFF